MTSPLALTHLDEEGVLTITMNRPDRRNAMNPEAFRAVGEAFVRAQTDPAVAVVLLTGAGDDFSSGMDLTASHQPTGGPPPFEFMMDAICTLEKPLVAAVRGCAIGYGMTVLFHCDVVYVGESARMRMPFANLGLVTEAASCYLAPLVIGQKQAAELLYTADWVDAARAVEYGIATRAPARRSRPRRSDGEGPADGAVADELAHGDEADAEVVPYRERPQGPNPRDRRHVEALRWPREPRGDLGLRREAQARLPAVPEITAPDRTDRQVSLTRVI
jgi:enoyl-CoA hydratase/carnithine racemase